MSATHFIYHDSSDQEQPQSSQGTTCQKECKMIRNEGSQLYRVFSHEDMIKKVIKHKNIAKTPTNTHKYQLDTDAIKRISANYQYFVKKVNIDNKYYQKQKAKVQKLSAANRHKNHIYHLQKSKQYYMSHQNLQRTYIIQKKTKEAIIQEKLNKQIRQIQHNQIINRHKDLKTKMQERKNQKKNKLQSVCNRQADRLEELKRELQELRQEKRVNKKQQKRVLECLQKELREQKIKLREKVLVNK